LKQNYSSILIKDGESIRKILVDDIYFISKQKNKILIFLKNDIVESYGSLYNINAILTNRAEFIRTHKSFIVNMNKIYSINKLTDSTYNIKFIGVKYEAFITKNNLKPAKESQRFFRSFSIFFSLV
jgi:DNA-binding LytR/AlgR family response regulator